LNFDSYNLGIMNQENAAKGDSPQVYHLNQNLDGQTVAAAIKKLQTEASWGQVKRWIAKRHIEVNGNLCIDEARRVQAGDVIKVYPKPLSKPVETDDIRLAYIDEHCVVVEKPAGVTSVRHAEERTLSTRRRQLQPTLEELLPPVLAKIQRLRWPPLPPKGMNKGVRKDTRPIKGALPIQNSKKLPPQLQVFACHRLDRNTSGLMLFARTREAEQRFMTMFRRHTIQREYVAVCHGIIAPQTIESMLVRDRGDGLRGSVPANPNPEQLESAEKAITHVLGSKPIADGRFSLLRCRLETGRTHQIRIHLSEAGHRLCGEPMYIVGSDGLELADDSKAPRQALHSDRLIFKHPFTGEEMKFEMPWPKDLANWIRSLG
jgi:23S rRNA pseudouridine1911/1915/1917 synthase